MTNRDKGTLSRQASKAYAIQGPSLSRVSHLSRMSSVRVSFDETLSDTFSPATKSTYSFMDKRAIYHVYHNGEQVTPQNLPNSEYLMMEEQFTHAVFDSRQRQSEGQLARASRSYAENVGIKVYATTISLDDLHIDYTVDTEAGLVHEFCLDEAPSAFYLTKVYPITMYPPEFNVALKETETIFLFALPTYSYEKGTPESVVVEQENEYYAYMTVGKGRNRKTICAEAQTEECIVQTRHTMAKKPQKKNAICFASVWDMHDTYALERIPKVVEVVDEMVMYQSAAHTLLRKKTSKTEEVSTVDPYLTVLSNPRFQDAVVLVERVLANNVYIGEQKRFRGLVPFDPLALDLVYVYSLNELWVFTCPDVAGLPVADTCFNPANQDILAAAYGKFLYADPTRGAVCVWCSKNPRKPERTYYFDQAACSVAFSETNPNWLACGFDNGDVLILDITSYEKKIIAKSKRDTNPCFEPMWCVVWGQAEGSQEYVMGTCQDGRINRYTNTKTHEFICTPMMRVTQVEGKVRGVYCIRPCLEYDVPIIRNPAALCYMRHPSLEHVYYVGTDEGCVHKCSTNYLNQHMEVFRAHVGPVYDIQFSPYWSSLMATAGADWAIRLWLEGIDDPILQVTCGSAVYGVAWCPKNSTIMVSVSGCLLCIWDIRRKSYVPSAEYRFPSSTVLTYVHFGDNGDTLFVSDNTGKIHTFHLEDLPIAPFYQKQMLEESIRKVLSTRPHIARQLEKLERLKSKG